ncbi:MAG: cobaltochelatase subunit CobN [Gammaproteobacteria bacterium]
MAFAAVAKPVRIVYLYSDGNIPGTVRAYRQLLAERPDLKDQVTLGYLAESVFDETDAKAMTGADVLVLDTMNEQMLERFNQAHSVDLLADVRRHGVVLGVGEGLLPKERYLEQGVDWDARARAYWAHAGATNQLALMKYALTKAGVAGLTVPEPERSLDFGYYYPSASGGRAFATWNEFDAWRRENGKAHAGRPRVAIGFYKSTYYTGDTELLDSMIAEVERQGADAIPYFGYPGAFATEKMLLDEHGAARADVALGFIFNFADFDSSNVLAKVDVPIINLVSLYGRSEKEWRSSATGLSMFEGTFLMAVPELAGTVAPTVVGSKEKVRDRETGLAVVVTHPIPSRVSMAVARGLRYATLRSKRNADKHIAILYYNYPPGKANIGASYLNVAESLARMLQRLKREGYDLGDADLAAKSVLSDITTKARNVGGYAPGELAELLTHGGAAQVSVKEYTRWLDGFPPALRDKIVNDWGPPSRTKLMTTSERGEMSLVIPRVQYGNVILMPQPARGWGEDAEKMYHAKDLAPHHQYVASYAWLKNSFKADAVVHVGTHGTLEWLDGKDAGLSEEDAPDALIADLPDIYIYNVDVVGEGLVARRRGMAALVDHMVPPFKKGGLYADLAALSESINDHSVNETKNPQLAEAYAKSITEQVAKLGLAKDLGLDPTKPLDDEAIHRVENQLLVLKNENIPYGLHTFGLTPEKPLRESTIDAIVSADRSLLPNKAKVAAGDMEQRIVASGAAELGNFVRALSGHFLPGGTGGEPIRNPDSYPTGKNFFGIDPDKVPKPAAYALGVKLADDMLAQYVAKHGRYPEKVSFVIWGDETMRHEGVLESQIFHLLGTKPVWDVRGKVVGVSVIPRRELKRPRVDIVIASAAEGMFNNVTRLMDDAVQKVKAMDEAENLVRQHYLKAKATLIAKGYSEKDADRYAGVRIFDEPPGQFNLNTSTIAAASGTWDTDRGMADDYINKLGHGYGNGFWGEAMPDVFRMALSGTDQVVHSSSTMLYGALDNDDMFMYMGGLANAIRSLDGKSPEMVVTNTRNPSKPQMTSMDEFLGTEFRSRYVNPTWIEGMKKEGYAGAGEMRAFVEYLWGWKATAPDLVDDAMWKETFDVYVQDKHKLGLKAFFDKDSPFAYQDMTARMVETIRKGYWKADAATETRLIEEYVKSVQEHGVGCAEFTCGNPRLLEYVLDRGRELNVPAPALERFRESMEVQIRRSIPVAARAAEAFVKQNEARYAQANAAGAVSDTKAARDTVSDSKTASSAASDSKAAGSAANGKAPGEKATPVGASTQLRGYLMEQEQKATQAVSQGRALVRDTPWDFLWIALPLLMFLFAWRSRWHSRWNGARAGGA